MQLAPVQFEIPPFKLENWLKWKTELFPRLEYSSKLEIHHLQQVLPCEDKAIVVGAAPSVADFKGKIKLFDPPNVIISVNAAHDWLINNVCVPDYHVIFEPDIEVLEQALGGKPHEDVTYFIASHCHQNIFRQLEGYKRILWHVFQPHEDYQDEIQRLFPGESMIAGGYGTFFRCISIALVIGYRKFELFGVDSSFEGEDDHVEGYNSSNIEEKHDIFTKNSVTGEIRKFKSNGSLTFQAYEFMRFCAVNQHAMSIRIHGDGLLKHLHQSRYPYQYSDGD